MSGPDRTRRPPSRPTPAPILPEFREFRSDGGLRVRAARVARLPEVAVRLVAGAGAASEPAALTGATSLAVRCLPEGAAGRSARDMAAWLDHVGAGFGAGAGHDHVELHLHALAPTAGEALSFLEAVVLQPAFDPDEVARVRREAVDGLGRRRDDPAAVADDALAAAVFGDHPYGRYPGGTAATLATLDADALRETWERTLRDGPAVLIAAGDLEPEAFAADVARRFGPLRSAVEAPPVESASRPPSSALRLLHHAGSRQAEIRVGTVGLARGAPDEIAALVMNAALGGLFGSRLNRNLREDKGWTYGVRSGFARRRAAGPFEIRTAVDTPVAGRAIEEIRRELQGMRDRPPDGEELDAARRSLTLSLPRRFETTSRLVAAETERVAYGLPEDWWHRFPEIVAAVGRDDVAAVAQRFLDPAGLVTVIVADAEEARPGLAALGVVDEPETP
ncbi:MAG: pitrilysin family protein [Gemmatimonadota bacterium]|nr:pitrilysin family protein [Gemmatimonadota bacterium]